MYLSSYTQFDMQMPQFIHWNTNANDRLNSIDIIIYCEYLYFATTTLVHGGEQSAIHIIWVKKR